MVQVEAAVRATRAPGSADYQAQHAVAPAADSVVVGFRVEVVHLVDPFGVDPGQRRLLIVATGIEIGQARAARLGPRRLPGEMGLEVLMQSGATAGVGGIEE